MKSKVILGICLSIMLLAPIMAWISFATEIQPVYTEPLEKNVFVSSPQFAYMLLLELALFGLLIFYKGSWSKRNKITVVIVMSVTFIAGFAMAELLSRNVSSEGAVGDFPMFQMPIRIGFALLIGLIFFCGCWIVFRLKQKKAQNKTILLILILLSSLLFPVFFFPKVLATTNTVIDVIGVGDEEFNAMYPEGWERYLGWEIYIYDAFGRFRDVFGLDFQFRGWISFHSDNSYFSIVTRLEEARQQTNFTSKFSKINGYTIDILLVFTGQAALDYGGYANPNTNTVILFWYPEFPRTQAVMHEISHLFYLNHCHQSCVMNVDFLSIVPKSWCNDHINELNTNGFKTKFYITIVSRGQVITFNITIAKHMTTKVQWFVDDALKKSQTVNISSEFTYTFNWNPTGFTTGTHNIRASVTYYVNNSFTFIVVDYFRETVFITILGDINGDGYVDILDADFLTYDVWSYPGHPRWNYGRSDLNGDNVVDIWDAGLVAINFEG